MDTIEEAPPFLILTSLYNAYLAYFSFINSSVEGQVGEHLTSRLGVANSHFHLLSVCPPWSDGARLDGCWLKPGVEATQWAMLPHLSSS